MQVEALFLLVPFFMHKCLSDLKVSNQNYVAFFSVPGCFLLYEFDLGCFGLGSVDIRGAKREMQACLILWTSFWRQRHMLALEAHISIAEVFYKTLE